MGATADGDWCPNCGSPHCPASCYGEGMEDRRRSANENKTFQETDEKEIIIIILLGVFLPCCLMIALGLLVMHVVGKI